MGLKIWLDGKFYDKADAKVSVYDHGLLYGDGVFEGMRVYNGKLFEAESHFRRLYESARAIRLTIPFLAEHLKAATDETFKINKFTDCYIRLVVTRGVGNLGLGPNKCETPTVFIIADTIELYPKEMYEKGMSVITASVIRNHPNALSARIKSLNYLNKYSRQDRGAGCRCSRGGAAEPRRKRGRMHRRQYLHREKRRRVHPHHVRRHPRRRHAKSHHRTLQEARHPLL